jgi:hypothetical protein
VNTREVAAALNVHPRSVPKATKIYRDQTGTNPPGFDGQNYGPEFMAWFNSRQGAKPWLRGQPGAKDYPTPDYRGPAPIPTTPHVTPIVSGLTSASRMPNDAEVWGRALAIEERNRAKADKRHEQTVVIPDRKPILLALLTDPHLGNAFCTYSQAKAHAEWVRDTDGVYGGMLGDVIDNWVSLDPRLLGIQREQPMQHADELALLESWLGMMRDKLVVAVSGNHDLRTYRLAGVDLVQRAIGNAQVLYDQYEVKFTLRLGDAEWKFKVRHSWPGRSQLIDTYAIQKDSRFNDGSWDIGVGGHTHGSTVFSHFRDKPHENRLKLAVLLGSYEYDSSYARELNLPRSEPGGCGAIMFWPNGSYQYWYDLGAATRFLAMERAR